MTHKHHPTRRLYHLFVTAALLVGLAGLTTGCEDEDPEVLEEVAEVEPQPVEAVAVAVTDLDDFFGPEGSTMLVGRDVALEGLAVTQVVGDSTFFVGEGTEGILVVLEGLGEAQTGDGTGIDGEYNVDEGEVVSVYGTVAALDDAAPSLEGADMERVLESGVYINANRLRFDDR